MENINETLENLRVRYLSRSLDIGDCEADPHSQFTKWIDESLHAKCDEPNAFTLSTVKKDQPRARILLLKGIHQGKFIFYTNYQSAKGDELQDNQKAAMTFLWLPLQRQIRIEGVVSKISATDSDEYFHKRPRGSQLGALASPQSQKVENRSELEQLFKRVADQYGDTSTLPRPAHWGGYGLEATYLEFWQGRDNRMHDRIAYEKKVHGWELSRLAP